MNKTQDSRRRHRGVVKATRLILAGFILVAAALQLNDPDPLYWVTVYTAAAALVGAGALGRQYRLGLGVAIGAVLAGMALTAAGLVEYLQSGDWGSIVGEMLVAKPYVEQTREFLGLSLTLAALVWVLVRR